MRGVLTAGARASLACGATMIVLAMVACGDDALFGTPAPTGAGGDTAGAGANGTGASGQGGDTDGVGGSAAGPSAGGTGGTPSLGGGGEGGSEEDPWVQPQCNPGCSPFETCCDMGDGSPPSCVNDAAGCKCDVTAPDDSCGGFAGDCCATVGSTIGTCQNSNTGCACVPGMGGCGFTSACCDKGNGGFECSDSSSECLCGSDPGICGFFFDVCCDKGDGERCYSDDSGCMN